MPQPPLRGAAGGGAMGFEDGEMKDRAGSWRTKGVSLGTGWFMSFCFWIRLSPGTQARWANLEFTHNTGSKHAHTADTQLCRLLSCWQNPWNSNCSMGVGGWGGGVSFIFEVIFVLSMFTVADGEINEQSSQSKEGLESGLEALHCHIDRDRQISKMPREQQSWGGEKWGRKGFGLWAEIHSRACRLMLEKQKDWRRERCSLTGNGVVKGGWPTACDGQSCDASSWRSPESYSALQSYMLFEVERSSSEICSSLTQWHREV